MALALYRKYRPRTFAEVIGQEHVTEPLSQALRSGRLNHAYLFSGPRGCGKTSSARILARSLNCEQGPTPEPCGVCGSCKSLANDGAGSIDVIEIDAASHGGVDDARELREKAFFAPANSRYKIYVIDEAHMVSPAGFNALLKLVEEPPEYVKFIFATTEPEKVLGTIRSRTHHYPFRLIPPATLRPYLQQLTEAEGVHVDPAVFPLVVRAGGGSARDTLSVLDQLIAGAGPEGVSYPRAVALLGVTDVTLLDEMCDALAAGDGAAAYQTIDRVAEAGHDPRRFASDLLERFRDLIVLQQVPDAVAKGLIDGPTDQLDQMAAQATRLGPATLSRCADIVHNGLVEMRGTTAPRLLLELITARMLLPGADDSSNALLQRLERMERRFTGSGAIDLAAMQPAQTPAAGGTVATAADGAAASGGGGISAARAALAAAGRRGGAPPAASAAPVSAPAAPAPVSAPPAVEPVSAAPAVSEPVSAAPTSPASGAGSAALAPGSALPVSSGPVSNGPVLSGPVSSGPVSSGPVSSGPVSSGPVSNAPVSSGPASSGPVSGVPVPGAAVSGGPVSGGSGWAEPAGIMPDAPEDDVDLGVAAVPGQLTAASIRERWPEVMIAVGRQSKKIAALAQGATVRDFDGQTLVLTFRFPAHARMVAAEPQLIADALYEEFGARWSIRCDVAGDGGGGGNGGGSAPRRPQGPSPRDNGGAREPAQAGPPAPTARAGGSAEPARGGGNVEAGRGGGSAEAGRGGGNVEPARGGGNVEPARGGGNAETARGGGDAETARGGGGAEAARGGGGAETARMGGSAQAAPVQAQSRGREPAAQASAAHASVAEDDDGGWPEPVRPGGSARSVAVPAPVEEDDDNEWPETAQLGGQNVDPGEVAALRHAPAAAGAPVGSEGASMGSGLAPGGGPTEPVTVVPTASPDDSDNPPWDTTPTEAPEPPVPTRQAPPAPTRPAQAAPTRPAQAAPAKPADPPAPARAPAASSAIAAARAAAARGGAPTNRAGAATRGNAGDSGGAPAGNAAPVAGSPVRSAAQAAALKAASNRGGNGGAWADGSPTEEAPYDPEYDGPPRHADPKATIEGFDPGDEPLDEVIDEKTARQSSEQQAMQLLRDAFGAETISES
ncbi:hypothetical protein GCM10010435_85500 [Winogradskya consettensis]|uniref:DNA polymerase III subunit gamma/tau n=1 Tax=Winogradskya consettensis TaxID=113560 RepID=A0A919SIC3_9ACTN|nr:DNA polymerase III subunit gamma and tau [Actinoplanes consettensis]GIM72556.1 hypothetical protein Aco04nite_30890 [Actinoplanes consettensis]